MSEHNEQAILFQMLNIYTNKIPELEWIFAIPNGGLRNKVVAMRMKSEGLKAGVWDIFIPLARLGYHGCFIEMKFGKNTLTENQIRFRDFVWKEGYLVGVAYSWREALKFIFEYIGREIPQEIPYEL